MILARVVNLAISIFISQFFHIPRTPRLTSLHQSNPVACFSNASYSKLEHLIKCLDVFTVPHDYYDNRSYTAAQPDRGQRAAWADVITSLLDTDNCSSINLPNLLTRSYSIHSFAESAGSTYCVLAESNALGGVYEKGWGLFIVPAPRAVVGRHLHISAPHPIWDMNTPEQAVAIFKGTEAKSLFIPGRVRSAFLSPSNCVQGSPGNTVHYKTDPTHDNSEIFYLTNKVIWDWQNANGGCPSNSCAFIQIHGKGPSTCRSEQVFLSAGLGSDPSSRAWYTNDTSWPVKRLKNQLRRVFPTWNISLPSDAECHLTATKNIVGRLLNGISDTDICHEQSTAESASGSFVHIEQALLSRGESSYQGWTRALSEAFDPVDPQLHIPGLSKGPGRALKLSKASYRDLSVDGHR